MARQVFAIAAMAEKRVIGDGNAIPWHVPEDMKRFSRLTKGHTVLMGRKTYESLPEVYRPLPQRKNVVVTRNPAALAEEDNIEVVSSPTDYVNAFKAGENDGPSDTLWVIGGEQIYRACMPYCDEIYLTLIYEKFTGDAFFPEFEDDFSCVEQEEHSGYSFFRFVRKSE